MRINLQFKTSDQTIPVTFRQTQYLKPSVAKLSEYAGQISVTPSFDRQILPTKGKSLNEDVEILPIQVTAVSNPSGGNTITI